jgi:hypothetical protein
VRALTFVEGTHTDALGKRQTYSQSAIAKYATNSNAWLDSGEEIPIFESPHDLGPGGYDNKNKIGLVTGLFSSQMITEEMLPKPQFRDLVGKLGLYADLELTRPDAIANYKRKLIKPISVGLGSFGKGPQVFEISVVPFGAVRGAMLFSHPMVDLSDDWEDEEDFGTPENGRKIFALTMDGAIAERDSRATMNNYSLERLTETFQRVIQSIKGTTDVELLGRDRQQLLTQAINDLSDRLRAELNVPALTPVSILSREFYDMPLGKMLNSLIDKAVTDTMPRDEVISKMASSANISPSTVNQIISGKIDCPPIERLQAFASVLKTTAAKLQKDAEADGCTYGANQETTKLTANQSENVDARFAAMETRLSAADERAQTAEAKLARMEAQQQVSDRFLRLKQKAATLNTSGKFSRAAYLAYFPKDEQLSDAVTRFSRPSGESDDADAEEVVTLDEIEAALRYAEKFGAAIPTGSISGEDPLPAHPLSSVAQAEEESDMARFSASRKGG